MKDFERLLKNVNNLDLNDIFKTIWSDNKVQKYIVRLNTKGEKTSQLYELGEDSQGLKLIGSTDNWLASGDYTPYTVTKKIERGQRYDHPTLESKGHFYESFIVLPNSKGFKVNANPIVDDGRNLFDLLSNGNEILGLNAENEDLLLAFVEEDFNKEFEKRLFQ